MGSYNSQVMLTTNTGRRPLMSRIIITTIVYTLINSSILTNGQSEGWNSYLSDSPQTFHNLSLTLQGDIPPWLRGIFLRSGAAQLGFSSGRRNLSSWMDGWGKLYKIQFKDEEVLYSGRMVEVPNYVESMEKGELVPQDTLCKFEDEDEEWTFWEKLEILKKVPMFKSFENVNPASYKLDGGPHSDIFMAVTDNSVSARIDIDTLAVTEMLRPTDLHIGQSAHWLQEPGTRNSINWRYRMTYGGFGDIYVDVLRWRPGDGYNDAELITSFLPNKISVIHSFSVTENFVIFFFTPLVMQVDLWSNWINNFHLFELLSWDESTCTTFYIVNLNTGEVQVAEADPFFSVHQINSYEEEENIILDLCLVNHDNMADYQRMTNFLNPEVKGISVAQPAARFTINKRNMEVAKSFIGEGFDFPTINEAYRGRKYCIVYGWISIDYSVITIIKRNICTGEKLTWHKKNHYPSEMSFVADPEGEEEDSGVLITLVYNGESQHSYLMVMNATTFLPVATADLPYPVPWSAHGYFHTETSIKRT